VNFNEPCFELCQSVSRGANAVVPNSAGVDQCQSRRMNEFLPRSIPTTAIEVFGFETWHAPCLGARCQLRSLAGQEHGRTIPLAVNDGRSQWFPYKCTKQMSLVA